MVQRLVLSAALLALLPCASVAAQSEIAELHYDLRLDIPIAGAAGVWLLASEFAKADLAAHHCRWCDQRSDGSDSLNVIDSSARMALRWHDTQLANVLSNVSGFGLAPLGVIGTLALAQAHDDALRALPVDLLIVVQAVFVSQALNQLVKFATGRQRPFVHALPEDQKAHTAQPSDNNTSFYSGHSNMSFALAVAAGTVASMRRYRWSHWVWIVGLTIASATGYLRIAADRHYLSDVLTGASLGAALGFALPYTLHARESPQLSLSPMPQGFVLSLSWQR